MIFSMRRKLRGLRPAVVLIAVINLVIAGAESAERRINLPLESEQISITGEDHEALKLYFSDFTAADSSKLPANIQGLLIGILPDSYEAGCEEMIGYWGDGADNVPGSLVRAVYAGRAENAVSKHILLAYRCFSYRDYYRDTYYDERLLALSISADSSRLVLLPHDWNCKNSLALSQISADQTFELSGELLVSVRFSITGENPCCGGPFNCDVKRFNYYLFQETGVKQVASVLEHKGEYYHDDVDGDGNVIYDAEIMLEEDADGDATDIVSKYSIKENGELREEGVLRYIWSPAAEMFEEGIE